MDSVTVPVKWHLNPSNGLSTMHKCDRRQTTDRETDHATGKCVAISGIVCARAILPKTIKATTHAVLINIKEG